MAPARRGSITRGPHPRSILLSFPPPSPRGLLLIAALAVGLASSPADAQSIPRPDVAPGEGPRVDYRDEAWEFWWFLNEDRLVEERRVERAGKDARPRPELAADVRASIRDALETGLHDTSADVRSAALVALARLGDREVLPRLVAALEDDVHEVRRAAARAIGVLGDPSAVELLEEIVRDDDRDGPVRQDAAVALGLLDADAPPAEDSGENRPAPPPPAWTGHDGGVTSIAVGADLVLSGGADGRVRRHDPADGAATVLLEADAPIAALSLAPDGALVAVAADDVAVVPLDGGRPQRVPVDDPPRAVALEPERAERVAAGAGDGALRVFRIAGGRTLSEAEEDGAAATVCRWPAGGEKIAVGAED
ncbi:MAG: HEAT repeat domain-containing protein, partial [Planctomycetota bacterium JB042]